jgi:hypothetical protein
MIHIGIDPGIKGFICILSENADIIKFYKTPIIGNKKKEYDIQGIANIFNDILDNHKDEKINVVLEKPTIIPISGSKSISSTFFCSGVFQGVLASLKIPYQIISAREWQKLVFKSMNYRDTKQASILFCVRKYPNIDFRATDRSKNRSDDKTDSCCMAYYSYLIGK